MGARWLYMLPALLLSVLAVILAVIGLSREPEPARGNNNDGVVMQVSEGNDTKALEHTYWVATHDLGIGTPIKKDDFRKVSVSVPLAQAVPEETAVEGQLLRRNVREGEILAKSHLEAGNRLAQAVPAGYRAFAIGIDNVTAVGGLLQPGDLVDVLADFRNGQDKEPTSMVLLSSLEVLAVNGQIEDAPEQKGGNDQRRGRNATAVLAVPRQDLVRLQLADANGSLRLAMAGDANRPKVADNAEPISKQGDPSMTTKLDALFPEKKKPVVHHRAAPNPGNKVEVYEGATSRSTYVH
ncbi:hypothetical protein A11A3_09110 [Alcanivorax hongdengensis A-11-3]|uniref:SAF domain-containing protein n=1 Tax=Alcanivorax hongdengensis A-11-3 TaxID=1177179 RepID=L0WDU8_9GAMM|nr:Flp pilus assembly protein CpaB [Alcanivorax hongdengensis]EKF74347.1 hypothetical protein A11A3_09110 [Alcanivorax hongdengensis A-11-3]